MLTRVLHAAVGVCVVLLVPRIMAAPPVHPRFEPGSPKSVPFPSDWFTVRNAMNLTGLRVELPMPRCDDRPSDCEDVVVINTLDGFNVQPRLSIPFERDCANQQTVDRPASDTPRGPTRSVAGCDRVRGRAVVAQVV